MKAVPNYFNLQMNKLLETVDQKGFIRPTLSLNFQLERAKTVPRNNLNICQEANLFKKEIKLKFVLGSVNT